MGRNLLFSIRPGFLIWWTPKDIFGDEWTCIGGGVGRKTLHLGLLSFVWWGLGLGLDSARPNTGTDRLARIRIMTRILFEGFFRSTLCWHLASGWIDELSASRIMKTLLPSTLVFDMHVTCLESQSHESPARPANFLLGFQECICNSNFGTYDTCSRMNWVHMLPSTVRGKTNTLSRGLGKKRGRISFNHSASRAHYLPLHLPPSLLAPVFAWVLSSPSKDHTQPPSSFCTGDGGSKRVIIFEKVEVGALSLTELWIENGGTVAEAGRVEFIHPCYVCRRLSLSDLEAQPFKQFSSHLLSCLSDLLCSLNPQFLLLLLLRSIVLNLCRFLASS